MLARPSRAPRTEPAPPSAAKLERASLALAGAFATPPDPAGIRPTAATEALVRTQVRSLLEAASSYHQMPERERAGLEDKLVRVAAYGAECLRDIYWQSQKLGQTPVLKEKRVSRALANDFAPRAASQIGNVTQQTLRAIAFPTFVADLIRGTFDAIFQTNVKQMEAFSHLISNVSKTVDQFMEDNVSDEQAHGWLAETYPRHLTIRDGKAVPRDGADQLPPPNFDGELHTSASLDESSIEETLVPAARRRLAETRLQMLSTMVLMGINRIVVTAGKIRATMGFHIDTSDSAFERTSQDIDARVALRAHYNALVWGVEASASLAYVSSTRAGSDAEINTSTDLTGEVELHFKSDYFPAERFAPPGTLRTISNNTAVPEANPPPTFTPPAVGGAAPTEPASTPRRPRRERAAPPAMTPVGSPLPEARMPTAPTPRGALDPAATQPAPAPAAGGGTNAGGGSTAGGGSGDAAPSSPPAAEPEPEGDA